MDPQMMKALENGLDVIISTVNTGNQEYLNHSLITFGNVSLPHK